MSNTKDRITELRKRIQRNKGIAARAFASAQELRWKGQDAESQIARDQREIEDMGGKVRR